MRPAISSQEPHSKGCKKRRRIGGRSRCAMLAEAFLRVLHYREDRALGSSPQPATLQAHAADRSHVLLSDSTDLQTDSANRGPTKVELGRARCRGLNVAPEGPVGLLIPGCPPVLPLDPDFMVCLDNCSLLEQYPDVQVATIPQHALYSSAPESCRVPEGPTQQGPQGEPLLSIPDQGYLAMGPSVNISFDLSEAGLEPMSNSVLNGLLEKQLEEVYMQHLTDNLARCDSHLGNSLLRGLVPPPPPGSRQPRGPDSLEASLEQGSGGDSRKKISYPGNQTSVPCSSNFSSPVLRISEAETYLQ
ncbi:uncharacterized protein si:dkey-237j10.2 isoform X2 [Pungitius pungitius]|uniref:uncharacterized protein si:dkey-237j10.2 isoform X2 n=1 Tax=Pungitius pungitius TaxID=134920 RepID=UPI002E1613BE